MLKVVLREAKDYHLAWDRFEKKRGDKPEFNARLDPLRGLFKKEFPVLLHAYGSNIVRPDKSFFRPRRPARRATDHAVQHFTQHGGTDLHYPSGHLQGYGFVPSEHEVPSHIRLETVQQKAAEPVPTKAASHYS